MRVRGLVSLAGGLLAALLAAAVPARAVEPVETPWFAHQVIEGLLPPVSERLPAEPALADLAARGRVPGVHGGLLRMFIKRAKDVRYMSAYGYARLVGYDAEYRLKPDILRDVTVSEDGREVTLHLRRGHRWSDGHPFTTEDLRYWWEDVANHPALSPKGPPVEMLVEGRPPVVEVVDDVTIRYRWHAPNPRFLPALARARPVYIYRPAHYMKRCHVNYADPAALAGLVARAKARDWAQLHNRIDNLYKFDNPDLPVLQPWVNASQKNSQRYVLVRNPFFHRVDTNGRQLPYIDRIELEIAAVGLIPLKVSLGEAGLQPRYLTFTDAPVLKKAQAEGGYVTLLWRSGAASEVALYPNLTFADPEWQTLFRDRRFRRALSLGISRKAINKVLYFGLAAERAVAALEESPYFDPAHATAYARFDPEEANRLLDAVGLDRRDAAGTRLLPDGRPAEIIVETAGERQEVADTLELVKATWAKLGLRLLIRPLDRDILRDRAFSGRSMMVAWYGWNNGIPTAEAEPNELAPVEQANFSWPAWGQHYQTRGAAGRAVNLPEAARLMRLYRDWMAAPDDAARGEIWREMLAIHAREIFVIGTVARAPIPIVADARLRNFPAEALYAWDPGAQIGMQRIDELWLEPASGGAGTGDAEQRAAAE
ncbi:ABC transporter substrate-binding protein [Paralimibaculum aggregatum]|uniref:ABC transporter substrate-binding protein n=1 Tax=Paralimibaculum aggregatum TaxID=3036245 RepID=A0ABQ6LPQ6_9RHOB|nr:ABC transporter substrate-binding protein [Limibaculum sp. NKW23]GMG83797.1 ABC transporter substrate-binding protein [Limibaculum sp. NKW23]